MMKPEASPLHGLRKSAAMSTGTGTQHPLAVICGGLAISGEVECNTTLTETVPGGQARLSRGVCFVADLMCGAAAGFIFGRAA